MNIDPVTAAEALAGAKVVGDLVKTIIVDPVSGVVAAHVKAFAEQRLVPALQRVLPLPAAAALAATDAAARLADVPAEQLVDPSPAIAAGVVQALQTRADEPALRAMFAELLASACRADRAAAVHLAYVEVLRQLEPDEARLLAYVAEHGPVPGGEHRVQSGLATLPARFAMELWDPRWKRLAESGRLPVYEGNLLRLGLLEVETISQVGPATINGASGFDTKTSAMFTVTDFGRDFLAVCAPAGVLDASGAPGTPAAPTPYA